jgi:Domain of unknown function (DUF4160)
VIEFAKPLPLDHFLAMPTIFTVQGYRFFFYSNEGDPCEPVHVHVRKGDADAKVLVEPEVVVMDSQGFSPRDLRFILTTVESRRVIIRSAWNDHFGN